MNEEKLLDIASKLLERSQAGDIAWSETADTNTYSAAFPEYSVTILILDYKTFKHPNNYAFSVYNDKGMQVESIETSLERHIEESELSSGAWQTLSRLYDIARSQALKSNEILDDLLTRLSSDG